MFRHWLRFVQPLVASFLVMTAAATGFAQETPDPPSPPADPAPAAAPEAAPAAEAEKPAPEPPAAEMKEEPKPEPQAPAAEAKEEPKPAPEAPATEMKEEPKPEPGIKSDPEAAPPETQPKPPTGDPAAVFADKLAEWKDTLKELRSLRIDFRTATPDQVGEIQAKWAAAVARAETLIEPLRDAGKAAYLAAPNTNDELTEFLVKIVADDVKRDDYEPAVGVAKALLDNGCTKKELYDPAAIAAFATNDFDTAETWGRRAQSAGTLSETGGNYLKLIPSYKKLWDEEQKVRAKEAEQNDLPRIRLTTSKGEIVVELFENEAPETVGNFVSLVERKFYDGLTFHRVLPGFMAQGGCPRGDGTGDPGYKIYCECNKDNHRKHFRGTLSMAHAGLNTGGSQFFITFVPTPHLNGQHTAFGRVVEGMEVLAKLQRNDPDASGGAPILDKIVTAEVIRKREHEYKPRKVE